jgi:PAS domain S-box-containing protein
MTVQVKQAETTRDSLELLYNISRELVAALDLRTVLQRVLLLSMRNVGAVNGTIIVLDNQGQPVDSTIIVGTQIIERTTDQLRITFEQGLAGWVARQKQAVLIPDTSQDERWIRRPDDEKDKTGPKSAVSAPLLARNYLVGVMTLVNPSPGFFTQEHLALVQAIADQAGIAVLNARLYEESQRQTRVMTAVAESAGVITGSLELEEVLQRILEQITLALRVHVVSLALIDPREETLKFHISSDKSDKSVVGLQLKLGEGIAGRVAKEGQGIIVSDTNQDPRFYSAFDRQIGFVSRAIACAPIKARGKVIGVVEAINPKDGVFDSDALQVLTGIGNLAGTAIYHAQLFEQIQAAHQRYLELFEDSIDPIIITDRDGKIVEANRQAELTTHFDNQALLDLSIGQLHTVNQEKVGKNFMKLSSGSTLFYESVLQTREGRQVPVQVYAREVLIDDVSHLQWILRDITERKNLDSMRDDLISMIYHDLRSPLANIVSSLDVFDAMLPQEGDPAFRSLLNIALRSTERIQRLTNSLLDINRLETGQPVGNTFPTAPILLASEAVDAVLPVAETKDQVIKLGVPSNLPHVMVEGDMIRRVLTNLLENSVKFTLPGGEISVGGKLDGEWVQMWVQDTGPGIPSADQRRIFDKYTRLKAKDGPKGIGLGLAYCRLAVEGHGGRIWVESQPGQGARFCFTLPILKN